LPKIQYNKGMTHIQKHLFVDLEETLIDNWFDANLASRNRVLDLMFQHGFIGADLQSSPPVDATVWSFAIWGQEDVDNFNKRLRKWLGEVFNLNFVRIVTTEEMRNAIVELKGFNLGLDVSEMVQIWSKDRTLEDWVKLHIKDFRNSEIVLLDDMVMNRTVHFEDDNVKIRFVRV